jgi:hypothetical protein
MCVTGTRAGMTKSQKDALQTIIGKLHPTLKTLMHGDCVGSDASAHTIARGAGLAIELFPCNLTNQRANCETIMGVTTIHSVANPLARNNVMVEQSDLTVAFPRSRKEQKRGSGTWQTVRRCKKVQKPLIVVYPEGDFDGNGSSIVWHPKPSGSTKPMCSASL